MSTQSIFNVFVASAVALPVMVSDFQTANAQKFMSRQSIVNGLQIQNPNQVKQLRKRTRSQKQQNQQVFIPQTQIQKPQRVSKRRAPAQQNQNQQFMRAPDANNQVAVRRAPAVDNNSQQFRAPQQQTQQFRAPPQNQNNVVQRRAPDRIPQQFTPQIANNDSNIANQRAIRLERTTTSQVNSASVDLEILFEYNSAQINPGSVRQLITLGDALQDAALSGSRILIAGHTDASGSNSYNFNLSYRRARSVTNFLINYAGISSGRLSVEGYGEELLKYPDAPNSGQNRRVEIINLGS